MSIRRFHMALAAEPPDPSIRILKSAFVDGGKLDVTDVIGPIYDEVNKKYGTNEKPPKYAGE